MTAMNTPVSRSSRRKADAVARFKQWLTENGAEVLSPTNPYEIARWRSDKGVSIIYRKESGSLTFVNRAREAWDAFGMGRAFRFARATPRKRQGNPVLRTLLERDGPGCFYCRAEFTEERLPTVEHLVSRTHGGPDHISNKFLACRPCNERAGHLSAPEKIRMRAPEIVALDERREP